MTAPACPVGWAELVVSNSHGSATEVNGFLVEAPPVPTIVSLSGNQGLPGTTFTVTGTNFAAEALTVPGYAAVVLQTLDAVGVDRAHALHQETHRLLMDPAGVAEQPDRQGGVPVHVVDEDAMGQSMLAGQ